LLIQQNRVDFFLLQVNAIRLHIGVTLYYYWTTRRWLIRYNYQSTTIHLPSTHLACKECKGHISI